MKRRRFLKQSAAVGTALLGASTIPLAMSHAQQASKPNILVIVVDQLRTPQWFPNQATLDTLLPSLARLRKGAVSFAHHYTAATACSPARGCLLTGLYAHQTYLLDTQENDQTPSLNPGFPTWGTFLRDIGYQTYWFGKWHVNNSCDIDQYGFGGGTCPSPKRTQLTSSVDIVPLLLTLASGNNDWRTQTQYAHLAQRLDLTALLRNPAAPGRKYILHTADETLVEGSKKDNIPSPSLYGARVPWHVIGYRTANAKLGLNAFWGTNTIALQAQNQQAECYDYSTGGGQIEVDNIYTRNPQFSQQLYQQLLNDALPNELRAPLPSFLQAAQQQAQQTYFAYLNQLGLN